MPNLVATYGRWSLPIIERGGDLLVWWEGRLRPAHELAIAGVPLGDIELAWQVVPAQPGTIGRFLHRDDPARVWRVAIVAWRIDPTTGFGEAVVARNNEDGLGPASDLGPGFTLDGIEFLGLPDLGFPAAPPQGRD